MPEKNRAYKLKWDYEMDGIDFELASNRKIDWLAASDVLENPSADRSHFPSIRIIGPGVYSDCFSTTVNCMFSRRAITVIGDSALADFDRFEVYIDDAPYYILRCQRTIDCFDRERSIFDTFPDDPSRIMGMKKYVFREEQIPDDRVFCIPELSTSSLFCTSPVVARIKQHGLVGIMTIPIEELTY